MASADAGVSEEGASTGDASYASEEFDVFIAGGGPAGTTAAMRCKELGLTAMVVDADDLMKRIRDYDKEKLILPSFGGGDKFAFPAGGELLKKLQFEASDKDDLVSSWKALYEEAEIPVRTQTELIGIEEEPDGRLCAITWNQTEGCEVRYRTRNVIMAVGAGVPRVLDVTGDAAGIPLRLQDAENFVGGPALVIGGGTSAAEAVISISRAKKRAEDETCVYWSYRGRSMPKVSQALGPAYFDAHVGNGNVRYLPLSEPVAVVPGEDRRGYLSLRVDRKAGAERPIETVHYEFPKSAIVACIGEDPPVNLLQRLGIQVPLHKNSPRMLVSHDGESNRPGVFLVGDARGPSFFECPGDFGDSGSYKLVKVRRNIKAAMRDASCAVEVIARRMGIDVPEVAEEAPPVAAKEKKAASPEKPETPPVEIAPPTPASSGAPDEGAPMLLSLSVDRQKEGEFPLAGPSTEIGRQGTELAFPNDPHMADVHASIELDGDQFVLRARQAEAGTWQRVLDQDGVVLKQGDQLWIGQQSLQVLNADGTWVLRHYDGRGQRGEDYPVSDQILVGRLEAVPLDRDDTMLSRRHCQFRVEADGQFRVYDRGAANGTFLRVQDSLVLEDGAEFRIGSSDFRFERGGDVPAGPVEEVLLHAPQQPSIEAEAIRKAAPVGDGFLVTMEEDGEVCEFSVTPDQSVLDGYIGAELPQYEPLGWECKKGVCGQCAVAIVEGGENFEAIDPSGAEMKTIKTTVGADASPDEVRLACLARINGPVKVSNPE